jgi:hypothetical protein
MAGGLFGSSTVGTVTLVETPVSHWYARRARLAALVVGLSVDVLVTAVASVFVALLWAVLLGVLGGIVFAVVAGLLVRVWPVLRVLWWWSFEITAAVLVVGGWVALAHAATWWIALAVVGSVLLALVVVGRVRRFVWAWLWCLVDRHRLRSYFAQDTRSPGSRPGLVPLMLWARPTPAGERVWLWLRTGLSLEDLEGKAGRIAVACGGAKQVRVLAASERSAALLRIDVTRRDPLTGRIDSPLALLIPSLRNDIEADAPVSPAVPLVGLDLADIAEIEVPQPRGGRR